LDSFTGNRDGWSVVREKLGAGVDAGDDGNSPAGTGSAAPVRALLITGGCCHDYARQKDLLKRGIEARAYVQVTQVHTGDTSTKARFEMYNSPEWAQGYDVIIHDDCTSDVTEIPYVENILAPHRQGLPAVNLHCAMHEAQTRLPLRDTGCSVGRTRIMPIRIRAAASGEKPTPACGQEQSHEYAVKQGLDDLNKPSAETRPSCVVETHAARMRSPPFSCERGGGDSRSRTSPAHRGRPA
jgi:hypothetical protein